MNIPEFLAFRKDADAAIAKGLQQAKEQGLPLACTTCERPSCCSQDILAYVPESRIIADRIRGDRDLEFRVENWVVRCLAIPREEMVENENYLFDRKMYCPFFLGRRCVVYEDRPLACRIHHAFEDNDDLCNQYGVENPKHLRLLDPGPIHKKLIGEHGMHAYLMSLCVMALLHPESSIGKSASLAADYGHHLFMWRIGQKMKGE